MGLKTSIKKLISISGITLTIAVTSGTFAHAELGGDSNSVQKDSQKLGAPVSITEHPHYRLHEMTKAGFRVHEFMDANGKVFGVAWRGKKHPDLKSLMGSHFSQFQAALGAARNRHHHGGTVVVDTGNLHLEMGGHMMAIYGIAWLSDQIPSGMNAHEIQ